MNILLVGASGFVGSALARALQDDGHLLRALGRDLAFGRRILPDADWRYCDLRQMGAALDWIPLLNGIDVVINASGALQSGLRDNVMQVQDVAMSALFTAAEDARLSHVIHISAAGAELQKGSDFMASKARADAVLADASIPHTILRPGLVIGRNSFGGTELLRGAAALPLLGLEIKGTGKVQCVAMGDVIAAVRKVLESPNQGRGMVDLVEADGNELGQVIALHRQWLSLPEPCATLTIPVNLLRPVSWVADVLGWLGWRSPLRSNSLAALVFGVKGDAGQSAQLLGRAALSLPQMLSGVGVAGKADRWHARLALVYPIALFTLFLLWFGSGLVGLMRTGQAASYLVVAGLPEGLARAITVAGSLADLVIAAAIAFRPFLRRALQAGFVLALFYCFCAVLLRPDLWTEPMGAMLKVLPILALTLLSLAMAEER